MSKYVIFVILRMISSGEKSRNSITVRIKNFDKERRESAISECIEKGYVNICPHQVSGRGRTPFYVSITDEGKSALESMIDEGVGRSENSVWRL